MSIRCFQYEAAMHCIECTEERFGVFLTAQLMLGVTRIDDNEGNPVHVILTSQELDEPVSCDICLGRIERDGLITPKEEVWQEIDDAWADWTNRVKAEYITDLRERGIRAYSGGKEVGPEGGQYYRFHALNLMLSEMMYLWVDPVQRTVRVAFHPRETATLTVRRELTIQATSALDWAFAK